MKKSLIRAFFASFALALALTLSCSLGSDGDDGQTSGTFTDSRDGRVYKWVKINGKTWMAENLNYVTSDSRCYGEGGTVMDIFTQEETTLSDSEVQANCVNYGRLYNIVEAMANCPSGWHLSTHAEWTALINFAGGDSIAGAKLKSKTGWFYDVSLVANTDDYGFSALPGGFGGYDKDHPNGVFIGGGKGLDGSSMWFEINADKANGVSIGGTPMIAFLEGGSLSNTKVLASVRCIKD